MTVGTTTGRVGSQTTAHSCDRRVERATRNGAVFDTGHATTERCTGYRQSIGMRPYRGLSRIASSSPPPRNANRVRGPAASQAVSPASITSNASADVKNGATFGVAVGMPFDDLGPGSARGHGQQGGRNQGLGGVAARAELIKKVRAGDSKQIKGTKRSVTFLDFINKPNAYKPNNGP